MTRRLRLLGIETGKICAQLIMEAVKNLDTGILRDLQVSEPKTTRSSMNLGEKELSLLKNKAGEIGTSVTDRINRAVKFYYDRS